MSAERNYSNPEESRQKKVFPLKGDSIQTAVNWAASSIKTDRHRNYIASKIQEEDQEFYAYTKVLAHTRNQLHPNSSLFISTFENGAFFMRKAFQEQFAKAFDEPLPQPTYDEMIAYVTDLLGAEWNGDRLQNLTSSEKDMYVPAELGEEPVDIPKATDLDWVMYTQRLVDQTSTVDGKILAHAMTINSEALKHEIFDNEKELKEVMSSGNFIKTFGPTHGLLLGVTDVYVLYSNMLDNEKLNLMWEIEVK